MEGKARETGVATSCDAAGWGGEVHFHKETKTTEYHELAHHLAPKRSPLVKVNLNETITG